MLDERAGMRSAGLVLASLGEIEIGLGQRPDAAAEAAHLINEGMLLMSTAWDPKANMRQMELDPTIGVAKIYDPVLSQCPVHRVQIENFPAEWWGAFGYDELLSVLKNVKVMSSTISVGEDGLPAIIPLFADPPLHTGYRKLLYPNFLPGVVKRIEADIRVFADEMVAEMAVKGDVEFYTEFAAKFPTRVLCRFLGVPDEDWPVHYAFSMAVDIATGTGLNRKEVAIPTKVYAEFLPYVERVIADHREKPRDDIIDSFINGRVDGRSLENHEIVHLVIAMMLAGHATTTAALSNFVLRIASDLDLQNLLRENPSRILDALEECLRIDAPQQALQRKCLADTELGGEQIKAGDLILANYGSANVDPRRFPHPEKFDIDRAGKGHLSFGYGLHHCLGQHLVRLDMRIAVETLLKRTSSITLAGPVKRRTYPVLAAIELPLRIEPAAACDRPPPSGPG